MLTKLSSKGQLIIPKSVRRALALEPGTQFEVEVVDKEIVLKPLSRISGGHILGKFSACGIGERLGEEKKADSPGWFY
jgi:AbrB family looped-hinge helix DNA binding protein